MLQKGIEEMGQTVREILLIALKSAKRQFPLMESNRRKDTTWPEEIECGSQSDVVPDNLDNSVRASTLGGFKNDFLDIIPS